MNHTRVFVLLFLFLPGMVWGQNVGVGTAVPVEKLHVAGNVRTDNASILWPGVVAAAAAPAIAVQYSAVRITAVAGVQANAVSYTATAAEGQELYIANEDGDVATFVGVSIPAGEARTFIYTNGVWRPASGSGGGAPGWLLTGNAGTVDGVNFLGTTDAVPLTFRVNNQKAGRIESTSMGNTLLGYQCGNALTASGNHVGMGYQALFSNTSGTNNTALGSNALRNNTSGGNNVAVGNLALNGNTTGGGNVAIGHLAGFLNTTGNFNVAVGRQAGQNNTAGGNVFIGDLAGQGNTSGAYNVCIGMWSGNALSGGTASANTFVGYMTGFANTSAGGNTFVGNNAGINTISGSNNSYLGCQAGQGYTTGANNTFVGWRAGFYTSGSATGGNNVFLGYQAGDNNMTGTGNVVIGYDADVTGTGFTNAIAIGNMASVNASNKIRLGNTLVTAADMQVNWTITSDRNEKADVRADVRADVPGMALISRLEPVTYYYKGHLEAFGEAGSVRYTGLIAQDVDSVLRELGIESSIVARPAADGTGSWGIRYGEMVMPLIAAVKEESRRIERLEVEIAGLRAEVDRLRVMIEESEK
jgi:hypothetical protein